jgi:hypothetical protein
LTYKWGFDGGIDSHCWEVDPSGVSKVLERDDHEASLLVRRGSSFEQQQQRPALVVFVPTTMKLTSGETWQQL